MKPGVPQLEKQQENDNCRLHKRKALGKWRWEAHKRKTILKGSMEIPRKKINKEMELGVHQRENTIRKWILEAPKQKINKRIQL